MLGINIDGSGARGADTAVSLYGCPDPIRDALSTVMAEHPGFVDGEPWFESDLGLFLMHGRPAIAITSANARELCATVTHSPRDRTELADPQVVGEIARFLEEIAGSAAISSR